MFMGMGMVTTNAGSETGFINKFAVAAKIYADK